MDIFVDSGAPTLYNTMIRKNKKSGVMGASMEDRKHDDFSFIETEKFKDYRDKYIQFLLNNKKKITTYANLDVINNPEATWENQKYFESCGLKPVPVFHFGSDIKWLKKYLDKYDYIAMGGMIPNSYSVLRKPLDHMWETYLTDKKGLPTVKIHGFAVTSPRLVHRYPWYSVDSTSWVKFGIYGLVVMPRNKYGKYDYTTAPNIICVSARSPKKDEANQHIETLSKFERAKVIEYIENKGFKLGKSKVVKVKLGRKLKKGEYLIKKHSDHKTIERVIEEGVCNNNIMRDSLNALFYVDLGKSVPEWPWAIKFKKRGLL